jgi:hypothetical protein
MHALHGVVKNFKFLQSLQLARDILALQLPLPFGLHPCDLQGMVLMMGWRLTLYAVTWQHQLLMNSAAMLAGESKYMYCLLPDSSTTSCKLPRYA